MKNKKNKNTKVKQSGFSLIEILVVLLIIGLLSTLVAVNVLPSQDRARFEKAKADIAIMGNALEMYRLERFNYPNSELGLKALLRSEEDNYQNNLNTRGYIKILGVMTINTLFQVKTENMICFLWELMVM